MALKAKLIATILVATMALPRPVEGQERDDNNDRHWFASVSNKAKWVFLGAAAGLTTFAALKRENAQDRFDVLVSRCSNAPQSCMIGPSGVYVESDAEQIFQETLSLDREARNYLLGGQIALTVSGLMFLVDLLSGDHSPGNIPYTGLRVYSDPNHIGLSIGF